MQTRSIETQRKKVWSATKLAIRRYSRDPSRSNAEDVRSACRRLRNLPAVEARRRDQVGGARSSAHAATPGQSRR